MMTAPFEVNDPVSELHNTGVPCPSCSEILDALTAPWCHCLGKQLSISCTRCDICLCRAPRHVQRDFWKNASPQVFERQADERRRRASASTHREEVLIDVLLVDDDEEILVIAAYVIQQMGYTVATATGAAEALEIIERTPPSMVITDALMPKMDGRELCREIKLLNPNVRVAIMTALYTAPHYKYEAFKTFQADEYLAKPIDFDRLREVVEQLIPSRQADA